MQTRKSFFKSPFLIASFGCLMAFAVACGDDDDDPAPGGGGTKNTAGTGGTKNTAGTKSDAGEGTGNTGNTGKGGTGNDGKGGEGNQPTDGGVGGGAGGAEPDCINEDDKGCFDTSVTGCKPKKLAQFLNACPTDGCEPFDNGDLSALANGEVPPLP